MPRGLSSSLHLLVNIGCGIGHRSATPGIDDLYLQGVGAHGKHDANAEGLIEFVAVLHGVDAGLGHGGLKVLNALFVEAHEFSDARRCIHGHLFVAKAGRQVQFDDALRSSLTCQTFHLHYAFRNRTRALMSSDW